MLPHGKPDFSSIEGPVLGHFGTEDDFVPTDAAKVLEAEIRDAGVEVTFFYYDQGGHAFFNETDRLGTYNAEAAQLSWERTVSSCAGRST